MAANPYLSALGLSDSQPSQSKNPYLDIINNAKPVAPTPEPNGLTRRIVQDLPVGLAKSAVSLGETAVGLADIPTLGLAGKGLEKIGYRPKETQAYLESLYSPETQQAAQNVAKEQGFLPTLGAVVGNPSVIPKTIVESSFPMAGGLGVAGKLQRAYGLSSPLASGIGESAITAGQNAEQVRQESTNGLLSPKQAAISAGSGALTGLITAGTGRVANSLGIGDINQLGLTRDVAGANKGLTRRIAESGGLEGFQEGLQSAQEQASQNLALDKPIGQDVGNSAALGAITGLAMGAPTGLVTPVTGEKIPDLKADSGALTRALHTNAIEVNDGRDITGNDQAATGTNQFPDGQDNGATGGIGADERNDSGQLRGNDAGRVDGNGRGLASATDQQLNPVYDRNSLNAKEDITQPFAQETAGQRLQNDKQQTVQDSLDGFKTYLDTLDNGGTESLFDQEQGVNSEAKRRYPKRNEEVGFNPTHEDVNGNLYQATIDPFIFVDQDGSEWEDDKGQITPISLDGLRPNPVKPGQINKNTEQDAYAKAEREAIQSEDNTPDDYVDNIPGFDALIEQPTAQAGLVENVAPESSISQANQNYDPLPSDSYVKAEKQSNGKYKLYFIGTRNEVFPGEIFNTPQEARSYLKVQRKKTQDAIAQKTPESIQVKDDVYKKGGNVNTTPVKGVVGGKIAPGEKQITASGRETTPFPKDNRTTRNADAWLIRNAMFEAYSRGDDFNHRQFKADLEQVIKSKAKNGQYIPQASKDAAEEYLFGQQPDVPKPFLKPLVSPTTVDNNNALSQETPGEKAYNEDLKNTPNYDDGTPRKSWDQLSNIEKSTWEKNPTPRKVKPDVQNVSGKVSGKSTGEVVEAKPEAKQAKPEKTSETAKNKQKWGIPSKNNVTEEYPGYTTLKDGRTVGNRTVDYSALKRSKLERLLSKQKLTKNDIEDLKDFKWLLIFDEQGAFENGLLNKLHVSQKGDAYSLKNLHWLVNIDNKIRDNGGNPQDMVNHPSVLLENANKIANPSEDAPKVDKQAGTGDGEKSKPLDHGELNVKGRTKNIDNELDKYKAEQQAKDKTEGKEKRKASMQFFKDRKAVLEDKAFINKYAQKMGKTPAEIMESIKAMPVAQAEKIISNYQEEKNNTYTLVAHDAIMQRIKQGDISADEFKASFDNLIANKDAITAELNGKTKDALLKTYPWLGARYRNEKKDYIVDAAYRELVKAYWLQSVGVSYGMGKGSFEKAIKDGVDKTTDADLKQYAEDYQKAEAERKAAKEERQAGMENPQTLDDYTRLLRSWLPDVATFKDAYMKLTPEQRETYDLLYGEKTRSERKAKADQRKTEVNALATTTTGDIIQTKHTKTGEDLFVVKAADRVEREVYNEWNTTAKRLGGWYSSFKGAGAVPGFQFKTKENAEAFLKYLGGDVAEAKEAVQARRDAYADDKSQSAVERLTEMADRLEAQADEELGRERKANTARRASQVASALASAERDKALAKTMRNLAGAIESGKAKFLDNVRQKVQVEYLRGLVNTTNRDMIRQRYKDNYGDYLKHEHDPATKEVAEHVEMPNYTLYRSDLADLGRKLLQTEGTKKYGQALLKEADDVTDAYVKFAKDNLHKVMTFRFKDGTRAGFKLKSAAERAIEQSNFNGKAIVLNVAKGEYAIILSPSEAMKTGIWDGDKDKRITISHVFGKDLVEKLGKVNRKTEKVKIPWQFENAYENRKRLVGMGIETPAELRAAIREFVGLQEVPKAPDKVKEMERAMIGRANDGLDFFPTPAHVADQMVESADIQESMKVLEPSAGWGHIAERIREAGVDPDVIELSPSRRELLEAKGFNVVGSDFTQFEDGGYDRVIMNPPFSDRRDAEHVLHAYNLLKPGGRLVAIMGEGVFFGQDSKAKQFRDWLDRVGGTDEKLEEGTFKDPSLPVNTGVNARLVVVDKPEGVKYSKSQPGKGSTVAEIRSQLPAYAKKMLADGRLKVVQSVKDLPVNLQKRGNALLSVPAWHGSPHDHDRFDSSKIGTGEGAQAFGYGLYFTDKKEIAEFYREELANSHFTFKGREYFIGQPETKVILSLSKTSSDPSIVREKYKTVLETKLKNEIKKIHKNRLSYSSASRIKEELKELNKLSDLDIKEIQGFKPGKLYQVELAPKPDEYLDWDKPLSDQSKKVREALDNSGISYPDKNLNTGQKIYEQSAPKGQYLSKSEREKAASDYLYSLGIRGIRYKANGGNSDAYNYVIFNDADVTITAKYSERLAGVEGLFDGKSIYLIADALDKNNLKAVLNHEIFHYSLATNPKTKEIVDTFNKKMAARFGLALKGVGSKAEIEAAKRVASANTPREDRIEEFQAYLISEYNKPNNTLGAAIKKLIADFIAAIRVAMLRLGVSLKELTPADLNSLALYAVKSNYSGKPSSSSKAVLASKSGIGETILVDGKERPTRNSNGQLSIFDLISSGQSPIPKGGADGLSGYAKTIANLLISEPFKLHGLGAFDVPTQRIMLNGVFGLGQNDKILDSIIELIPVDVMNFLSNEKLSPKMVFHDKSMLRDALTVNFKNPISIGVDASGSLGRAIATVAAKLSSIEMSAMPATSFKRNSAARAYNFNDAFLDFHKSILPEIKAIGNTGAFNQNTGNIKYSIASRESMPDWAQELADKATTFVRDQMQTSKTFNLLNKSVNTQAYKAWKSPEYKRVFDKSVAFEQDVAKYANEQADYAPTLLPSLDGLKDAALEIKRGWKRNKDAKAIGKSIFTATVEEKHFTDEELKAKGHTPEQIAMYHEFYATVNKSLDDLAKSEMAREARAQKMPIAPENMGLKQSAEFYAKAAKNDADAAKFRDKAETIQSLKDKAYAPLMRFGRYTVTVQEEGNDKPTYFGMYETESEAKKDRRILEQEYPDAKIKSGVMSQTSWKMFQGLTPETMEVFAKVAGIEQEQAFQDYLKLAVSNKSAMKRLIHRKNIEGYSFDTQRVLATFITSNARLTSKNLHLGEMLDAISDIPKEKGDVLDEAISLYEFVQNPTSPGLASRNALFAWYLGGSVASAAVNLTQSFTTTYPALHQLGSASDVAKELPKAMKLATRVNSLSGELKNALDLADKEGITKPQDLFQLYGDSARTATMMTANVLRPFSKFWGSFFALAESYNRRVAFIAAYNLSKGSPEKKFKQAEKLVLDTQFLYSKSSRPNWARSAIGSTAFTFKTFSLNYLEFLRKLPRREQAIALGVLLLAAGANGLPGADDADDLIDTIGQMLGYNTSAKGWKEKHINSFLLNGISEFMPFDISKRVGMGNIIPGSALFKRSETDKSRDILEFIGPAGSFYKSMLEAADAVSARGTLGGKLEAASHAAMPLAISNAVKAFDMAETGYYRDYTGKNVTEVSTRDALFKAIGFQPTSVSSVRDPERQFKQLRDYTVKVEGEIAGLWAEGIFEKDRAKIDEAKTTLKDWNERNPETPIKINFNQITRRVKAMRQTSAERLRKSSPQELRALAGQMARDN